jgi:lysophospholipase L1-like esterase
MKLVKRFSLLFLLISLLTSQVFAQEQGPERWESNIQKFETKDKEMTPKKGGILFVGSSSVAIWRDVADYYPGYNIINRGFGGSQFSDLIYYADRVIYTYQPKKVFVYEGDNDVSAGDSPKSILKEAKRLRKMIAKNLGKEVVVIFISPKPSVARWNLKTTYEETNALLAKYATKEKNTEYADVWTPALDENGKVFEHIFQKDNLHMNKEGYEIWKKALLPYVKM